MEDLQAALYKCLELSPEDGSKGPHGPIGSWDVTGVNDLSWAFRDSWDFKGDISKWDVSRATTMQNMFDSASLFNGDLSKWDVSRVIEMEYMFYEAESFNCDISKWDVSSVLTMEGMFYYAISFTQTLTGAWMTSKADKTDMFEGSYGQISTAGSKTPGRKTFP